MTMTIRGRNIKDNSKRRFSGGGPRPDNNELKRKEAAERTEAWRKLSPEEQLTILSRRPGDSTKQRARIQVGLQRPKRSADPVTIAGTNAVEASMKPKAKDRRANERAQGNRAPA
jgi:hypothetical protein